MICECARQARKEKKRDAKKLCSPFFCASLSISIWLESAYSADVCLGEAVLPLADLADLALNQNDTGAAARWLALRRGSQRVHGAVLAFASLEIDDEHAPLLRDWLTGIGGNKRASLTVPQAFLRAKSQPLIEPSAAANNGTLSSTSSASSTSAASSMPLDDERRARTESAPPASNIPSAVRAMLDLGDPSPRLAPLRGPKAAPAPTIVIEEAGEMSADEMRQSVAELKQLPEPVERAEPQAAQAPPPPDPSVQKQQ